VGNGACDHKKNAGKGGQISRGARQITKTLRMERVEEKRGGGSTERATGSSGGGKLQRGHSLKGLKKSTEKDRLGGGQRNKEETAFVKGNKR